MEEPVVVPVPGGPRLEGRLGLAPGVRGGFVLCHPHPLYGGDMENPVVTRIADVARAAAFATLRFNFRGVGGSEGVHDKGRGEEDDVKTAILLLAARLPDGDPVGVVGYSFGAWTAARAAHADAFGRPLCLIAPPLRMYDFDFLKAGGGRRLMVAGTHDPYCPVDALHRLAAAAGADERIVEGADHFFFGKLYPLGEAFREWVAGAGPPQPDARRPQP